MLVNPSYPLQVGYDFTIDSTGMKYKLPNQNQSLRVISRKSINLAPFSKIRVTSDIAEYHTERFSYSGRIVLKTRDKYEDFPIIAESNSFGGGYEFINNLSPVGELDVSQFTGHFHLQIYFHAYPHYKANAGVVRVSKIEFLT